MSEDLGFDWKPEREDLLTRLRKYARGGMHTVCDEAADEIERLRRELERYNPEREAVHAQRS